MQHAGAYAFAHRRDKKGDFRRLWNVKINASLRPLGWSYSKFIDASKKKGYAVDRKIMAHMAEFAPKAFERFVASVK